MKDKALNVFYELNAIDGNGVWSEIYNRIRDDAITEDDMRFELRLAFDSVNGWLEEESTDGRLIRLRNDIVDATKL